MKIDNQNNYPNVKLGYGSGSIRQYGCTLTSLSAVSGIDVLKLNTMLKGTSFANSAFAGETKNLINWTQLSKYTNGVITHIWRGYGYDQTEINKAIKKHGFCLVEVLNSGTKHWIVAIGNKKALDPLTGGEIPTSKYESWTGWSEVSANVQSIQESMQLDKKVFEDLVAKATKLDEFINAGYPDAQSVQLTIDTKDDQIRKDRENKDNFLKELIDIIDPNSTLPDLLSESWVRSLAIDTIRKFEGVQDELNRKQKEWIKEEQQLEAENLELEKQVKSLKKELEDMIVKHKSEIERLEKRIKKVGSDVDKNKEQKAENKVQQSFFTRLLSKLMGVK